MNFNKKTLIDELKQSFTGIKFQTYINNSAKMVPTLNYDYNFIVGNSKGNKSETFWISNIDGIPYIIFLIGKFYIYYSYGDSIKDIEKETPSIKDQPDIFLYFAKHVYKLIDQAFKQAVIVN